MAKSAPVSRRVKMKGEVLFIDIDIRNVYEQHGF